MFERKFRAGDVYFCKFGKIASFDVHFHRIYNIKLEKVKKGCFLKISDTEYQHILSGKIMKCSGMPGMGEYFISPKSIQQVSKFQDKYLTERQIRTIEDMINEPKQAKAKESTPEL